MFPTHLYPNITEDNISRMGERWMGGIRHARQRNNPRWLQFMHDVINAFEKTTHPLLCEFTYFICIIRWVVTQKQRLQLLPHLHSRLDGFCAGYSPFSYMEHFLVIVLHIIIFISEFISRRVAFICCRTFRGVVLWVSRNSSCTGRMFDDVDRLRCLIHFRC